MMAARRCLTRSLASIAVAIGWLVAASSAADVASTRPIGELLEMPVEEAQHQPLARIRGVTIWRGGPFFIMEDESDGIFVDTAKAVEQGVRPTATIPADVLPGAIVEVDGRVALGGFTNVILPSGIRVVGSAPLPRPRPFDAERFFSGAESCKLIEATGVVQAVVAEQGRHALTIETDLRTFRALVHTTILRDDPQRLVDAVVRVVGVQMGLSNTRGQPVDPQLYVDRAAWFEVIEPAVHGPFEVEKIPLESLGRFRRQPLRGHRIRTEGMVVHAVPGEAIYLQAATNGVLVETDFAEPLSPGDRVEVSGFLDRSSRVIGLRNAEVRRTASGSPPPPLAISADHIAEIVSTSIATNIIALPGDYDGCLIRFPATLVERRRGETDGTLVLAAGKTTVLARADLATFAGLKEIQTGSDLAVTGIVQATTVRPSPAQRSQPIDTIGLLLRSAADVEVTKAPPWWSPRRIALALLGIIGVMATVAAAAFLWIASLRRRVAAQLGVIEEQLQAEAVAEERRRIAREFHDRLDQGLAGLSLRFDAAASQAADDSTRRLLLGQRRSLASLQSEARDFLWDLRYPTHLEASLADSIRQQLLYMRQLTPVPLSVETTGPDIPLPTTVHYHLMRIIREAVSNAIKYAHAAAITVRIVSETNPRRHLRIVITDDGTGFNVVERTAAEGHFGVRGMHERARRIGARMSVESEPDRGTIVTIDLPLTGG
jgi:signal transduction histidine kinase